MSDQELRVLREQGLTVRAISSQTGVSRATVHRRVRDVMTPEFARGVAEGRRQAAEEIAAELERFIGTDLNAASAAEIARAVGAALERTPEQP
jgi:AraC-like DNA-binding protein